MGEVEVHFESLQAGGEGIDGVYRSLRGTLENLESSLQPMLQSWNGDARGAYHVQKKNWDDAADALGTILAQIGKAVQDAHHNYTSTEKRNTGLWSG